MKPPLFTDVPDQPPIELIAYYKEFEWYYPKCEMATKHWFVSNIEKDWVILDIGANIGYFSILFSRLATQGHVYAFEPTSTYEMLMENLAHHGTHNITALRLAVGKQSGPQQDAIFRIWGEEPERQTYPFTTIDEFVEKQKLSRLDSIKIDVDSFDFEVLQGAEKTLIEYNPFVMVELNHALSRRNQSNAEALEWMADLGYKESIVFDYDNFLFKRGVNLTNEIDCLPGLMICFDQSSQIE
jgi:FkbM family methyltransferase